MFLLKTTKLNASLVIVTPVRNYGESVAYTYSGRAYFMVPGIYVP